MINLIVTIQNLDDRPPFMHIYDFINFIISFSSLGFFLAVAPCGLKVFGNLLGHVNALLQLSYGRSVLFDAYSPSPNGAV